MSFSNNASPSDALAVLGEPVYARASPIDANVVLPPLMPSERLVSMSGGFNVAPTEVENALRQHPDVEDAAVVGLPSERSGEEVVAAVVVEEGKELDVEALRDYARGILTPYKVPRRIFVVDELPKSLIGKVLRRQVRESLLKLNSGS